MGWLDPKLEPGERLVWRYPDAFTGREWVIAVGAVVAITAGMFAIMLSFTAPENTVFAMINATSTGILILSALLIHHHWRVVLTDRRLVQTG